MTPGERIARLEALEEVRSKTIADLTRDVRGLRDLQMWVAGIAACMLFVAGVIQNWDKVRGLF